MGNYWFVPLGVMKEEEGRKIGVISWWGVNDIEALTFSRIDEAASCLPSSWGIFCPLGLFPLLLLFFLVFCLFGLLLLVLLGHLLSLLLFAIASTHPLPLWLLTFLCFARVPLLGTTTLVSHLGWVL